MAGNIIIGLFGLGTVGSGVAELLQKQRSELKRKYGVDIYLKKVVVRDINKPRSIQINRNLISDNPREILDDPEINTVIEVIGGISPAKEYILEALSKKKRIITANKAVLGQTGEQIFRQAIDNGVYLGFRAAVTGFYDFIPHFPSAISIRRLAGVFNGTCNYILTEMEHQQKTLPEVLLQAQKAGYAEQNPSLDIDGWDTTDKLSILCNLALCCNIQRKDIYTEGIGQIALEDICFARYLGYRIKLLGNADFDGQNLLARVHPCLVPQDDMLAKLEGAENGLCIDDELRGPEGFFALGAGKYPTASAILCDIINVAIGNPGCFPHQFRLLSLLKIDDLESEYYMRFNVINVPGVLEKIAGAFGQHDINIMSVLQVKGVDLEKGEIIPFKGTDRERGKVIPLVIMVDRSREKNVQKAIQQIQRLAIIQGTPSLIRVQESLW